jgi:Xaa-Pro aminopeptidase
MNLRLQKLRKALVEEKLDAIFISSLPNIIYLTNFSDFTTLDRDGFLLVTKKNQYFFTHGIYEEAAGKQVKNFKLILIKREKPISKTIKELVEKENIKKLGFESFDLKVNEYERLVKYVDKNILQPTDVLSKLRIKKYPDEIKAIQKACKLGDKAFDFIVTKLKPGVTEIELANEFEFFIKRLQADVSFSTIIAFGPNASKPHHVPTNAKLKKNQFVLIDSGVKLNNYCSDMTRTVFFGKATEKQKHTYQTVLIAQKKAIEQFNNEAMKQSEIHFQAKRLDNFARDYITSQNFPDMPHSLGHGIGLEVHEPPRLTPLSDEIIENGMVFSIEPGIYLPGKFGIRVEDLFAIENNKLVQLTKAPNLFTEI